MAKNARQPDTRISIKTMDLAVLLWHLHAAAKDAEIGMNDAEETLEMVVGRLKTRQPHKIQTRGVEGALYCCNLMDEVGKFWHPEGKPFDQFLKEIVLFSRSNQYYNRFYNYFEDRKKRDD